MKITKRLLAIVLAIVMAMPAILAAPFAADAVEVPTTDYWQIMASTDFTTATFSGSGTSWSTSSSPNTAKGGKKMGWNVQFRSDETFVNNTDGKGVRFMTSDQGLLYLSSYDGQTSNTIFNGVDSFKIDLAFELFDETYVHNGKKFNTREGQQALMKLSTGDANKYKFTSKYNSETVYFAQEAWGRRFINGTSDIYAISSTQDGGNFAITTAKNDSGNQVNPNIHADTVYHYVMYVANGVLGCYLADNSGNIIINYDPIYLPSNYSAPSAITNILLNASEFNIWAYRGLENIYYRSIEVYRGVDTSVNDTSKNKYLFAYFTGNGSSGETLHYAVSDNGISYKPVNNGNPVWDSNGTYSITQYPAGGASGFATSQHIRDPYIMQKRNTSTGALTSGYYVLATDLNTQNGANWNNNSKLLVFDIANLEDIGSTTPWVIDTQAFASSLGISQITRAWAPQAIWDPVANKYMLYWSVAGTGGNGTRVYYIYTSDFKTFDGSPKLLVNPHFCSNYIDADITYYGGLYYMYLKNEDTARIYRLVAPNASGPYSGSTQFGGNVAMEGPQVYQRANGNYVLLTDAYGEGNYYLYSATNPAGFSSADSSSNIDYLKPRHGGIVRITDAEYNAIISQFGTLTPNTVEYLWANEETIGAGDAGLTRKDTGGHAFNVAWYYSGASIRDNLLTLNSAGVYIEDSTVNTYLNSNAYTVDFTYKKTSNTVVDNTHSIFSISKNGDDRENYVRLSADGKFYVNGTEVAYTNASALTSAVADTSAHRYRITYNGYATCLMVDNTYVAGVLNSTPMQSGLWLTLGWSRGTMEDTRGSGEFGKLTVSPVATVTGAEDSFIDDLCSASDIAASNIKTFNKKVYHRVSEVQSTYYGNIAYTNADGTNNDLDNRTKFTDQTQRDHFKMKFATPGVVVGVWDGTTRPSFPIVLESLWSSHAGGGEYICFIQPNASSTATWNARKINFRYDWLGSGDNTDWTAWPSSTDMSFKGEANAQISRSNGNTSKQEAEDSNQLGKNGTKSADQTNTGTSRFWKNSIEYYGSFADGVYLDTITNATLLVGHVSKSNTEGVKIFGNWVGRDMNWYYYAQTKDISNTFYVLNYEPIVSILKSSSPKTINVDGNKNIRQVYDYLLNGDGAWKYTAASKALALQRLAAVGDVNPNTVDYSTPATGAANAAAEIKTAYDNFIDIPNILVKETFTVTYNRADGVSTADITAGNTLSSTIPANSTGIHFEGSETHSAFNWKRSENVWDNAQTPSSSHTPHSDETYYEEKDSNPTACTIGADKTQWPYVAANGDNNGYHHDTCTVCSHHYVIYDNRLDDWANYASAVSKVEENYNSKAFTTVSREDYKTNCDEIVADIALRDETKSQAYINRYVTALENEEEETLDPLADFNYFDTTYDKANTFLMSQAGKVPEYEATSMQQLVNAVEDEDVAAYVASDEDDRAEYGQAVQTEINALADTINEKMNGLKTMTDVAGADFSVYEEAVNQLNNFDPDAYDETDSITSARSTIKTAMTSANNTDTVEYVSGEETVNITVLKSDLNQRVVDDLITTTISALTVSIKKYDISTQGETGEVTFRNGSLDSNNKAPYGTSIRCTAEDDETAWYIEITTSSMHKKESFAGFGKYFSTKVIGETNIKALRRADGESRVKVIRKYDNAAVTERSPLQVVEFIENSTNYELPEAPMVAYYTFDGYYVGDDKYAVGDEVEITEDTDIIARYIFTGTSCSINSTNLAGTQSNVSVSYNDKVELQGGEGTYAWLEATDSTGARFRPFFIGEDVSFFASESIDLKAVSEEEFNSYNFSIPSVNLRRSGVITQVGNDSKIKTIFNAQLVAGNANIQEYGILIAAPSSKNGPAINPSDSQVIIENSGQQAGYAVYRAKSTRLVGANQFTIAMNNLPEGYVYRGYVIYKDAKGKLQNVYSQAMR